MRLSFIALFIFISSLSYAQKRPSLCREGCAPYVNFFLVKGDSLLPITYLEKNKANKVRIVLDGGIEKVKHKLIITSKNAKITQIGTSDDYWVTPQSNICELIVDARTYEDYQEVQKNKGKDGKETKEVIKTFPPKTYMVGYERFASH
ncbi:MAG: hypothetical protein H7282_10260 [Cytophagaceae bacterium]|nr:hypothetical protein [Cytophagaceae bacterium]